MGLCGIKKITNSKCQPLRNIFDRFCAFFRAKVSKVIREPYGILIKRKFEEISLFFKRTLTKEFFIPGIFVAIKQTVDLEKLILK